MRLRTTHRQTDGGLPDQKPLYIMCQAPAHITAGSDHLILNHESVRPQRFPIARICRIICNRHLSWSGSALTLCLSRGVPVTWMNGSGQALGYTQSSHTRTQPFSTLIDIYLELPDWPERFANWLARCRLEILTTCAKRAIEAGQTTDADTFQRLKREYVYNGAYPRTFNPEGQAWCQSATVSHLHKEGLRSNYWGFEASQLDLATELATLLWAELNLDCGALLSNPTQGRTTTHLFESWLHLHEQRLAQHLGDLKRHMAREVQAWH